MTTNHKSTVMEKYLAACSELHSFDNVEQAENYVLKKINDLTCFYHALIVPTRKIETRIKPAINGTIYEVYAEAYRAGKQVMVLVVLFRVATQDDREPKRDQRIEWEEGKLYGTSILMDEPS